MSKQEEKKEYRRSSLTVKLVWIQVRRVFSIMLTLDIIICVLFALGMVLYAENRAAVALPGAVLAESAEGYTYSYVARERTGIQLPSKSERLAGSKRAIETGGTAPGYMGGDMTVLEYVFKLPGEPGGYERLAFDISVPVYAFWRGMLAVLIIELLLFVSSIFHARRMIRRALRPLDELTQAAQSINTRPTTPARERVQLDEAIHTLNAITGDDLKKRIELTNDQDELQGLIAAINAMLERLDAAYESQLRFVSDASHELRTPIAVIQGYANLLDRWGKKDEKTLQEAIDAIKHEAEGMKELMEQLLFLARSDNRSIPLDIVDIDLSQLLNETATESRMIDSGHEIESDILPGVMMCGDAQLIKQAVRIIVDNALKYTPEGGRIKLRAYSEHGYAKVAVTDEGVGIGEGDIGKVFDRFYRADDSRARKTGGTGLGLAIANWIVDAHNGSIEVVSYQDVGTRMILSFKLYEKPAEPVAEAAAESGQAHEQGSPPS